MSSLILSGAQRKLETRPGPPRESRGAFSLSWLVMVLIPLATYAAYAGALKVPFLLDDFSSIVENPTILSLRTALFPPAGGLTVSGRPVVNFSFALNYAISGYAPWSYHVVNGIIHSLAALLLFGVTRRTVNRMLAAGTFPRPGAAADSASSVALAAAITFFWLLHPLQVESVTYIAQRAESLVSLFYLLTIYGFIRATDSLRSPLWSPITVTAMAVGMATKEVMVTAPVFLLLYDRTFISGSLGRAWRNHGRLYTGFALTWIILLTLVLGGGGRGGTAGFGLNISPLAYLLTQGEALVRYLCLVVWPAGFVFDYGTAVTSNVTWLLLVLALGSVTLLAFKQGSLTGFLGVTFFLILAPTSSIVPVATQTIAEHRIYLALAAVATALVFAFNHRFGRRGVRYFALVAIGLAALTYLRNQRFQNPLALWRENVAQRPENSRARYLYAMELIAAGQTAEAVGQAEESVRLAPNDPDAHHNLAVIFSRVGRPGAAIPEAAAAIRLQPDFVDAHLTLGNALVETGRWPEGVEEFRRALQLRPDSSSAQNNLAGALMKLGQTEAALGAYAEALRRSPDDVLVHANFAEALIQLGRIDEAQREVSTAVRLAPQSARAHYVSGRAFARAGQKVEARAHLAEALRLQPNSAESHLLAGELNMQDGRPSEALAEYREALGLAPNSVEAHFNYANALLQSGRAAEAVPEYEAALRLKPDLAKAAYNLGHAWLQQNRLSEALDAFQDALKIDPDNQNARFNVGTIYLQSGNNAEAVKEFSEVVRRDNRSFDGHAMLARALLQVGRRSAAIEEFERALQLKPNDAEVRAEWNQARQAVDGVR